MGTLFVANLPYDATATDVETAFSDLAPVRSAFVVLENGVSKGVGYVSFALSQDAQSVLDTVTTDGITVNGRRLRVQWAENKGVKKDRPAKVAKPKREKEQTPNDPLAIRTIVVAGLPPSINKNSLWKKLRKFEGAEDVEWPARGGDPSIAHVLFSSSSLAQEAIDKLHAHVFKGSLLSVTLKKRLDNLAKTTTKQTVSQTTPSRASRLIVRNLPFDVTEQDLRAIFLPHGPIHSIHIPLVADDTELKNAARSKGFAFVWMLSKKDAETALEKCNGAKVVAGMADDLVSDKQKRKKQRREEKKRLDVGTEVEEQEPEQSKRKERVIAVDWALSKERWEKEREKFEETVEEDVEMENAPSADGESVSEEEQLGLHDGGSEVESDADEGEEVDEDELPERDTDDESPKRPQLPHTDTGNTLFIRNIPFTATEDEIRTLFRAFGPLRYVRLTIDPETERPRGTGFACFWNKEDADKAIQQSDILRAETTGIQSLPVKNPFSLLTPDPTASVAKNLVLHGRTLDVVRAVTREQATKLKEDGEKRREKADKRNLYLLREGVILPNSPAAETISQVELEKRTNSFNARRTMLRTNPSLYVSKTRLSIRQIPLFVTERVLKRLAAHCIQAFDAEVKKGLRENLTPDELAATDDKDDDRDGEPVKQEQDSPRPKKRDGKSRHGQHVKQAKIVRQFDRVDAVTGKGRSRGYGFVELFTHADALRVLRWANNNPDAQGLLETWWHLEVKDLVKAEKAKAEVDEARVKRLEEAAKTKVSGKGTLIVEFSIENVQVVKRRAVQREKQSQPERGRKRVAGDSVEGPPSKKRRVSSEETKSSEIKVEEEAKPGNVIGSIIGRKRRARKAGGKR